MFPLERMERLDRILKNNQSEGNRELPKQWECTGQSFKRWEKSRDLRVARGLLFSYTRWKWKRLRGRATLSSLSQSWMEGEKWNSGPKRGESQLNSLNLWMDPNKYTLDIDVTKNRISLSKTEAQLPTIAFLIGWKWSDNSSTACQRQKLMLYGRSIKSSRVSFYLYNFWYTKSDAQQKITSARQDNQISREKRHSKSRYWGERHITQLKMFKD